MKVFIWFLFFLPIVYAAGNYDYFQLVQQWPPTVNGERPEPLNFTILGFWPSNSTIPGYPINCSGSPFYESPLDVLMEDLKKYWPNLIGSEDNMHLWKNQWGTNGTCSEDRFTEFGYFSLALELKKRVDIYGILYAKEIIPSKMAGYRSRDISDAIEQKIGHKPHLWCKYFNEHHNRSQLLEISICYDLALAYMDCPLQQLKYTEKHICEDHVSYPQYPTPTENGIGEKHSPEGLCLAN